MVEQNTIAEAARHVSGPTIDLGGFVYDLAKPNPENITLEDYAFALAYTVRFRGQTRDAAGRRCFYGVGQHLVEGARTMLEDDMPEEHVRAWLFHESGEMPFGDLPGPAKSLFPEWRPLEKVHCEAINAHFGVETPDGDLIKRWDIRMFLTEWRDLMPGGLRNKPITVGCEPFPNPIEPYRHPDVAAEKFMSWCHMLGIKR